MPQLNWQKQSMPIKTAIPLDQNPPRRSMDQVQDALEHDVDPMTALIGNHMAIPSVTTMYYLQADEPLSTQCVSAFNLSLIKLPIPDLWHATLHISFCDNPPVCVEKQIVQGDEDAAKTEAAMLAQDFLNDLKNDLENILDALPAI